MGTHFCTSPALFALLISSVVPACLQAATVSVCASSEQVEAGTGQQLYDASGQLVTFAVSDESPADTSCRTLELPLAAAAVRWLSLFDIPLSELPPALALQGRFLDASAEISEVIRAGELPTEPHFLPFGDNLLAHFDAKPFGVEERARFSDSAELVCAAGSEAAATAATLRLGSFRLLPPAPVQRAGSRRATWLWTPSLWLEDPQLAWSIAEQENLDKLHVTVPVAMALETGSISGGVDGSSQNGDRLIVGEFADNAVINIQLP